MQLLVDEIVYRTIPVLAAKNPAVYSSTGVNILQKSKSLFRKDLSCANISSAGF